MSRSGRTTERPLWRQRSFGAFLGATTGTYLGDRITELALPLIAVVTLGASATQVGLLTAAVWAPNVLALLVGAWVDTLTHKRWLLVAADLLRAVVLVSLPIAAWVASVSIGHLFVVALLSGAGQVLYSSAYPPFFVGLVPRRRYVEANGLLSTSRSLSFLAGPPLGGVLVHALTAPVAVLVDAVTFVVSAVVTARIRVKVAAAATAPAVPLWTRLREGLTYVRRSPYLWAGLGCVTTVNLFTFMAQAILVLFASRSLGLSAAEIGLAFGVGAVGGVAGAVLAPVLTRRYGIGRMIVVGAVLFPSPLALLAVADGPRWTVLAVLTLSELLSSAGVMLLDINLNSLQTAVIGDHVRSRVAGVFGTVNYGARPLGALAGGVLGDSIGLRTTLLIAAVGGTASVLWLLRSPVPRVHRLDELSTTTEQAAV